MSEHSEQNAGGFATRICPVLVIAKSMPALRAGSGRSNAFMPNLQEAITGQAPRVESGIDVNGFVTDKYELSSENLASDYELISAFVYVARSSGFITLFELQGRTKTDLLTKTDLQWLDLNHGRLH